ncbi:MAG: phage portal protein [Sphingomonadales bacterium]|jgi:HK97 family phage portal protein
MAENPIVQRSIRMVAQSAAQIRWTLARQGRELVEHPLLRLLNGPNPMESGAALIEASVSYLLLSGDCFFERVKNPDGKAGELYTLRPDRIEIVPGVRGWPQAYVYKVGSASHRFPVDNMTGESDILHLREFAPCSDHRGQSALSAAAKAIDVFDAAEEWNKALFDNSARPSGALVFEPGDGQGHLSEEQFSRLKREMEDNFQGKSNVGRPLLLEGGLKWQPMALSPADMDHVNTRNAAARDIALAFGVPPMLLGIPGDNTYSNYQEASRALWRLTVLPLMKKVTEAFNRWLTPTFGSNLKLDFDRNSIPALMSEREALWRMVDSATFLSNSEKRVILGLAPNGDEG